MDKQLRRILGLIRRTGDRMVVTDTNGEDVYVVMGLEQYESLVGDASFDDDEWDEGWWDDDAGPGNPLDGSSFSDGLAEPEASVSSPMQQSPKLSQPSDIWDAMQPAGKEGDTWDLDKLSEVEKANLEKQFEEYQRRKQAEVVDVAKPTPPIPPKKDDDFGEEQFYLEPVE